MGTKAIVKMLLARNDVDVKQAATDTIGTALYIYCVGGNVNICKMLSHDKIDANQARTDNGTTPLFIAKG